jgi:aminoglycoside 6'-N-acetyltransferase
MSVLRGAVVTLRPPTVDDLGPLATIRSHPEVRRFWGGPDDATAAVLSDLEDDGVVGSVIEVDGRVAGWIQWYEEADPEYRHAGMDIYVDPDQRGRGVGPDALRTLARHLLKEHGHHRLVIDPAADNTAAIRAYEKVGFKPIGIMRAYERGRDGTFHDNLLMDLLAEDLLD